jgi:hypothetical protein
VEEKGLRTQAEIERRLRVYVLPEWENLPFRDIKRKQVAELLDKIQDHNGPRQADLVLADLQKMANWYATRNDDYSSPIVKGMKRRFRNCSSTCLKVSPVSPAPSPVGGWARNFLAASLACFTDIAGNSPSFSVVGILVPFFLPGR